jgi:plasmid replication initiation protein
MRGMTVEICDWLFRAIVKDKRMLTYDPAYFRLGPLEKRLYEIARAHCGPQPSFRINIERLRRKVGSDSPLKLFKSRLLALSKRERSPIPEYGFILWHPKRSAGSELGRIPTKAWQVFFFRKDRPSLMLPPETAPLIEDYADSVIAA